MNRHHRLAAVRPARAPAAEDGAYRYHLLRAANERFQCSLAALQDSQRQVVEHLARQTFALEERVLAAPEARAVVIPESQVQRAYAEVRARYDGEHGFAADLARNGLDRAGLRRALLRELTFDAIMRRVGARHVPITETDERLCYELHRDHFRSPEQRDARHLLITINADYDENRRESAQARLAAIAAELGSDETRPTGATPFGSLTERFADLAMRHSECPTALEGGRLGRLSRGRLYPAIDAVLFSLPEGGISGIVESPIGLHLVLCESIHPARDLTFAQVRDRLRQTMLERARREAQRAWLAELREGASALDPA
jgi:peptidyl-prolyl cis-trans isomerase C